MNILAFESSCDETAVAVVRDGRTVLSDAILSQADMHALYGGVVPDVYKRQLHRLQPKENIKRRHLHLDRCLLLELVAGLEPATCSLRVSCSTN